MKIALITALLIVAAATATSAADVGVSISVGQPGFYGQIDIGSVPRPRLIFAEPVVVLRGPRYVAVEPVYLHVPPGHEKNWDKHCARYAACGRPVYFVRNDWYENEYVAHYRKNRGADKGKGSKQH
jgi:hypothetical protein